MEIQEIIKNMTLEEKSHLVNGATFFGSYGIDRLGVPRMQLLDGVPRGNANALRVIPDGVFLALDD